MNSHLTPDEWTAAFEKFGADGGWAYRNVSDTQLSIARHYGGIKVNDNFFYYLPETDELFRADVVKWLHKRRADAVIAARAAESSAASAAQGTLI